MLFTTGYILSPQLALAQIIPDSTIANPTRVEQSFDTVTLINGGTVAGTNLFHSFSQFDVAVNRTALFNSSADIVNIFARVTNGNPSTISGTIKTLGAANLFFINPAGVIFTSGAKLDMIGNFTASTIPIKFRDGSNFGGNSPLLTISTPIGLDLTASNNSTIQLDGADINGSNIELAAGNVNINSSNVNAKNINLFGINGINLNGSLITNSTSNSDNAGKINLTAPVINLNSSNIRSNTSSSGSAGIINLIGDNISLSNKSNLGVNTTSSGTGGTINIKGGNLTVINNSGGGSNARGEGNAGTINITVDKFVIENQSGFGTDSFSSGAAGNINITASEFITRKNSGLGSQAKSSGAGGNINITTNNLLIENYSGFSTGTSVTGTGNAGKMNINVRDNAVVRNYAGVGAQTDGKGNGGELKFVAGSLTIDDYSGIISNSFGSGNAGNMILIADKIQVSNSAEIQVQGAGTGNAGTLQLNANQLVIKDYSRINASTKNGVGGEIFLNNRDTRLFNNSEITASSTALGSGGNINIITDTLIGFDNSDITANSVDSFGGRISITSQGIFGLKLSNGLTTGNDITASSALGAQFSGSVYLDIINTPVKTYDNSLDDTFVDVSQRIQSRCHGGNYQNSFTVTGSGGLPQSPRQLLGSTIWHDLNPRSTAPNLQSRHVKYQAFNSTTVIEANQIIVEDGEIVLVNQVGYPIKDNTRTCLL